MPPHVLQPFSGPFASATSVTWNSSKQITFERAEINVASEGNNPSTSCPKSSASRREWNRMAAIVDAQLQATGRYIAGAAFSLADIPIGLSINRWMVTPMDKPSLPHVDAYYERLASRPGFLKHGCNGIP